MIRRIYFLLFTVLCLQACKKDNSINNSSGNGFNSGGGGTGQGGSLARFTMADNHLYVVDDRKLYSYLLSSTGQPVLKSTSNVGIDVETIYTYKDKLFIGSQTAMYIYSIANPDQPTHLSEASHVRACDPVVANDSMAYVTVRTGSRCGGSTNSLLIFNIRNITNPVRLNTLQLHNPTGLGLHNKSLYVCDGSEGLLVYDLADPVNPQLKQRVKGEVFIDVIPTDNVLIAMVQSGSRLYSYQANDTLSLASRIPN